MADKQGNGSTPVTITQQDMGGWVRFWPTSPKFYDDPGLPVFLSQTVANFFRHRPDLRLRFAMPMDRNGTTVEIHAWYDVHVLSPFAGPQAKETTAKKKPPQEPQK